MVAKILVRLVRKERVAALAGRSGLIQNAAVFVVPYAHQCLWIDHRKILEQNGIYQREDRRVRANPERKRKNRRSCKPRRLPHLPECISNVLNEPVEQRPSTDVANALLDLLGSTHLPAGIQVRLLR